MSYRGRKKSSYGSPARKVRTRGLPKKQSFPNQNQPSPIFTDPDIVSKYTSNQAVEDGLLFDVDLLTQKYFPAGSPFKHITTNLLAKGYWNEGENRTLNIANVLDLLTQASKIFNKKPADDWFVSGKIELPSGEKQTIFISQNETGQYTIMLPEDY